MDQFRVRKMLGEIAFGPVLVNFGPVLKSKVVHEKAHEIRLFCMFGPVSQFFLYINIIKKYIIYKFMQKKLGFWPKTIFEQKLMKIKKGAKLMGALMFLIMFIALWFVDPALQPAALITSGLYLIAYAIESRRD